MDCDVKSHKRDCKRMVLPPEVLAIVVPGSKGKRAYTGHLLEAKHLEPTDLLEDLLTRSQTEETWIIFFEQRNASAVQRSTSLEPTVPYGGSKSLADIKACIDLFEKGTPGKSGATIEAQREALGRMSASPAEPPPVCWICNFP